MKKWLKIDHNRVNMEHVVRVVFPPVIEGEPVGAVLYLVDGSKIELWREDAPDDYKALRSLFS